MGQRLGTPISGNLVNCIGYRFTSIGTFTSAELRTALSDETGTGAAVFATSPTITSPTITTPNIVGTATNDDASAGSVGEFVSASVLQGSAVSLTTGGISNITSISLTAGDWDITGGGGFVSAATTSITRWGCSIETANTTFGSLATNSWIASMAAVVPGASLHNFPLPVLRVSLSGAATYYLNAVALFTVSTLGAYGIIRARRAR